MDDFLPTASIENLRRRAQVLASIRRFFDQKNFFEVDTPTLSHDIVVDRYLQPVGISKSDLTGRSSDSSQRMWLQTSPEFGMKRLMVAGADAIYQICKCYRCDEIGTLHNPEFTMLEWYRAGDDMVAGMDLLAELVETILERPKSKRLSYREAFKRYADVDPFESSMESLESAARAGGIGVELKGESRDGWLNLMLSQIVEPNLGINAPMVIYDWPVSQSALAVVRDDECPVAERFEIYVDGVELANGYHELLDPEELARRNVINNQQRVKDGNALLPENSRLLDAMRVGMPQCSGVALGVDRLVMLAIGASTVADVIAFPVENA
ncbi:MAG: EF-P lysine aminoacylase EpmA [Mariniblastus sp.]